MARLRTADPTQEKQRLNRAAAAFDEVSKHLSNLDRAFGQDVPRKLGELRETASTAQQAADAASATTFGDEPLAGIGSPVWKALWQAAEKYSLIVYPEHEFPHADGGAVCVLCQQSLDGGGAERLGRFHAFVSDTTAQDAETAKTELEAFLAALGWQSIETQPLAVAIATIERSEPGFTARIQVLLDAFRDRMLASLRRLRILPPRLKAFGIRPARLMPPTSPQASPKPREPTGVDTLRQEVAALRRGEEGMSEAEYQRQTEEIAGHMSQTWERIISQVLAEPLVDYKSLEVRVGKLRVIGRVTAEDVKTHDDSYSRSSGVKQLTSPQLWAPSPPL